MIVFFIDAMDTLILKGASAIRRGLSRSGGCGVW